MKRIINQNVDQYLAYGICTNSNNEVAEEFYIIVNVDNSNKTFSIEPILNSPKSMDEIKLNNDNQEIEKNDYNEYNEEIYTNENQAENYLIFYKTIALAKPELLYNYMEDEYKNERFGSYNNFVEYIKTHLAKGLYENR